METSTTPANAPASTGVKIVIQGRLSYPDIFKPRAGVAKADGKPGDPRYGCHIIVDPASPSFEKLKQAFMQAAAIKWPNNTAAIVGALEASKKCVRNGNTYLDKSGVVRNGYQGMMYVVARSKHAPLVLADKFKDSKPLHVREDGSTWQEGKPAPVQWKVTVPYGGCYCNVQIEIYGMEGTGANAQMGKSVNATLLAVQFVKDGEAFGGSRADEGDFSQVGDDPSTPTGNDPFGADPFAQPAAQPAKAVDPFA